MAPFPGNRPQTPQAILQCLKDIQPLGEEKEAPPPTPTDKKQVKKNWNSGFNFSIPKLTFPKIQLKYFWIFGTSLMVLTGIYTQIDGYVRYGFIPANPILILKGLPGSIFLDRYERAVGEIYAIVIGPDNKSLAVGSFGAITIWDLTTDTDVKPRIVRAHSSWVKALAISPDGKIIASGSNDKTIRLWGLKNGNRIRTIEGHTEGVNIVVFSPDGQTLASGSDDKTILISPLNTGSRQFRFTGHEGAIRSLAFSPDGQTLASGSDDKTIRLWNLETGTRRRSISGNNSGINALVYHPDGKTLISAGDDGSIRLWNPNTGEQKAVWKANNNPVKSLAITKDGKTLVSGGDSVIVWDLRTGRKRVTLWGHDKPINALAVSSNGKIIVSGGEDKTIKIWQMP